MTLSSDTAGWVDGNMAGVSRGRPADVERAGACESGMGPICASLAEARAREGLAEQQLLELNHRMANLLQAVATGLQRQRRTQDDDARGELDRLEMRIRAAAALQRRLFEPGRHAFVDLGGLIVELASDIEGVTGLLCHVDSEPVSLPGSVAAHLAAGVNELAWNAYKHGYRGETGGVLRVVCRCDDAARLRLSVADHGRGLPPDFDAWTSAGLGLSIIRAAVRRFDGEFSVDSDRQTCFTLLLPLPRLLQPLQ